MRFILTLLLSVITFTAMASNKKTTQEMTKQDFLDKVYNYEENPNEWKFLGDKPVLLDFYASWCGPCKMIAPILEELAAEYGEQIEIYKVNTDKEKELAGAFGVRGIPMLLFIPKDNLPQAAQGAMSKEALIKAIDVVLLGKADPAIKTEP